MDDPGHRVGAAWPTPKNAPAALADRYRLIRELGRGGMATVFLADDLKHARQVAIKVMHPEVLAGAGSERFRREIEVAARLSHPHIVPLFDSGTASDLFFYVMPYRLPRACVRRAQRAAVRHPGLVPARAPARAPAVRRAAAPHEPGLSRPARRAARPGRGSTAI